MRANMRRPLGPGFIPHCRVPQSFRWDLGIELTANSWPLALRKRRRFALQLWVPVFGLVDAAGLRSRGVAGDGIGAGAGAAADLLVLAGAALALQLAGVAQ